LAFSPNSLCIKTNEIASEDSITLSKLRAGGQKWRQATGRGLCLMIQIRKEDDSVVPEGITGRPNLDDLANAETDPIYQHL
jgi:hypothetical protein